MNVFIWDWTPRFILDVNFEFKFRVEVRCLNSKTVFCFWLNSKTCLFVLLIQRRVCCSRSAKLRLLFYMNGTLKLYNSYPYFALMLKDRHVCLFATNMGRLLYTYVDLKITIFNCFIKIVYWLLSLQVSYFSYGLQLMVPIKSQPYYH